MKSLKIKDGWANYLARQKANIGVGWASTITKGAPYAVTTL
jgi:hypothetical protein